MTVLPTRGRQLQSEVRSDGRLRLTLPEVPVAAPGEGDVLVRVEAAPINPSDLGLLLGAGIDPETAKAGGGPDGPELEARIPERFLGAVRARFDQSLPVGNEGAGTVVAAGSSEAAQALLGRTVAIIGGATYSEYRTLPVGFCLPLPEGTTAAQGASCFVNPLTALGMVETMRDEGHTALAHTAAASNLGQMLVKLCLADGVPLVNIVRKPEQAALLRELGAEHVCDSSAEDFRARLTDALAATGATIAFDAVGGGRLASDLLACMEEAANRAGGEYSRYGSETFKQVYIYGGLDRGRTELDRSYGMSWSLGGWLLTPFLRRIGPERGQALRERVAREVTTTFASHYTREISLEEALDPDVVAAYARMATGEKFLITPAAGR